MLLHYLFLVGSSILGLALGQSPTTSELQCKAPKITKIKFSFNTYRNESGQWSSQVGLEHGGAAHPSNKISPLSLDLEQTTATCEGEETINVVANIARTTAPRTKKIIPEDYTQFSTGHYKLHTQGVSWSSARQTCADEGAHLVIINSDNEANVMKELFTKTPKSSMSGSRKDAIWVGIVEQKGTGKYFTIFGETLDSTGFSRWSSGDPNNSGTDACIWLFENNLSLADFSPCSTPFPYVCEIEFQ